MESELFAWVTPPVKLNGPVIYSIPQSLKTQIFKGSQVRINLAGKEYIAFVNDISDTQVIKGKIKSISGVTNLPSVTPEQMKLWEWIASYYMCSVGEVYKASYPGTLKDVSERKNRKLVSSADALKPLPSLTEIQQNAFKEAIQLIDKGKPVLLRGEPASGKSEIYLKMCGEMLKCGKSSLYLTPEITLCRDITRRAKEYFGKKVLFFHSGQTTAKRLAIIRELECGNEPYIIVGVRSAVLLPFRNLGLVIADEEHDVSFKQFEPAPRYNARDTSMVLAKIHSAGAILGSSTPSFETLLNVRDGKYSQIFLKKRFFEIPAPEIKVVNIRRPKAQEEDGGLLGGYLRSLIKENLESGDKSLIFTARKYMSMSDKRLCTKVIADELKELFPNARIAVYDYQTGKNGREQESIPDDFAKGSFDILVSNRATGKGFHFPGLQTAAIVFSEAMVNRSDFRSGERMLQDIYQIAGRAGRESKRGVVVIQGSSFSSPLLKSVRFGEDIAEELLKEREEFGYPPFKRLIYIDIKGKSSQKINFVAESVVCKLNNVKQLIVDGPFDPGTLSEEPVLRLSLRFSKECNGSEIKNFIKSVCNELILKNSGVKVIYDVDPL